MGKKLRSALVLFLLTAVLAGCTEAPSSNPEANPETLTVHFIDVGQADSALLLCEGESMLIDGGNVEDSSLLVSYLERQGVEELDYVVCTHAHEDHVGGLSGPLSTMNVRQVYSPVSTYSSKAFENFVKYTEAQGLEPERPDPDLTFMLGNTVITVLGPRRDYTDTNDTSIVLRADYGETSFLFTGDMEREAEADLLADGCNLSATVLKVGHHGSDTSTSYPFLREVMPEFAVISCGAGNSYGHPHEEVLSRLYDAGTTVYRTDLLGSIVAVSDGSEVVFTTGKAGSPLIGRDPPIGETTYIGNRRSGVFHTEQCPSLPAEDNRVYFASREEALEEGYRPCGGCKP